MKCWIVILNVQKIPESPWNVYKYFNIAKQGLETITKTHNAALTAQFQRINMSQIPKL